MNPAVVILPTSIWFAAILIICLCIGIYQINKNKKKKDQTSKNNNKSTYPPKYASNTSNTHTTLNNQAYTQKNVDEIALDFLKRDDIMDKIKLKLCNSHNGMFFESSEAVFFYHANEYAKQHNLVLLSKVRIADIVEVPNLQYPGNENLSYAIQKKHFDFVLCKYVPDSEDKQVSNLVPFLIVEVDGLSHQEQKRIIRDELVDLLMRRLYQHGNNIDIIHIRRRTLDDINTQWQTLRYKYDGYEVVRGEWLTVKELLDAYTH